MVWQAALYAEEITLRFNANERHRRSLFWVLAVVMLRNPLSDYRQLLAAQKRLE
jgi:hypothetical protein